LFSGLAADIDMRLWPNLAGVITAFVLLVATILTLFFFIPVLILQALGLRRSRAAIFVTTSLLSLVFGEAVFVFAVTQSVSAADRTILPLGAPGLINFLGDTVILVTLFGAPWYQFHIKEETQRGWDAVDMRLTAWLPRVLRWVLRHPHPARSLLGRTAGFNSCAGSSRRFFVGGGPPALGLAPRRCPCGRDGPGGRLARATTLVLDGKAGVPC